MKIGLFFGSFNPTHIGHLIIAEYFINYFVEEVWFVISPQNPFKNKTELLNIEQRILLLTSAIKANSNFKLCDAELNLPVPSYTIHTLDYLKTLHPQHDFFLIMGSDNFLNINKWKSADVLLRNFQFLVYKRPGFEINLIESNNIKVLQAPLINISSTQIRELIKQGKSVRYLVPENVLELIKEYHFYFKNN